MKYQITKYSSAFTATLVVAMVVYDDIYIRTCRNILAEIFRKPLIFANMRQSTSEFHLAWTQVIRKILHLSSLFKEVFS